MIGDYNHINQEVIRRKVFYSSLPLSPASPPPLSLSRCTAAPSQTLVPPLPHTVTPSAASLATLPTVLLHNFWMEAFHCTQRRNAWASPPCLPPLNPQEQPCPPSRTLGPQSPPSHIGRSSRRRPLQSCVSKPSSLLLRALESAKLHHSELAASTSSELPLSTPPSLELVASCRRPRGLPRRRHRSLTCCCPAPPLNRPCLPQGQTGLQLC